jgi:hypothetical protein
MGVGTEAKAERVDRSLLRVESPGPRKLSRPRARLLILAAITGSAMAPADGAAAEGSDTIRLCRTSHQAGQRLRREGSLVAAKAELIACSGDTCPPGLREDCLKRLDEVEAALPTVVFQARTADGGDVSDVQVVFDGTPRLSRLDGRPIELDPGAHRIRFERGNRIVGEQSVLVIEGEKLRKVSVTIPLDAPSQTADAMTRAETRTEMPRSIRWTTYALGGLGVLALGSFAYFGLSGKSEREDLYACRPACPDGDVASARAKLLVADVSLGVAIVALSVAIYSVVAATPGRGK